MFPTSNSRPAAYQITIRGYLNPAWADYLGGLSITTHDRAKQTTTTLTGKMMDQAALMGVLNNLYGLGFAILSVDHQFVDDMEVTNV